MLRVVGMLVLLVAATAAAEPRLDLRIEGDVVRATVYGVSKREPVELREVYDSDSVPVPAQSVTGFLDGGPVAIVFVMSRQEQWIGIDNDNDGSYELNGAAMVPALVHALDRLELGTALPAGSMAMLVQYATGAEVKAPWQSAQNFGGEDIGVEKDYVGQSGSDLAAGIELGLGELERRPEKHKLMIVIGDGSDSNEDISRGVLRERLDRTTGITIAALIVKGWGSPPDDMMLVVTNDIVRAEPTGIEAGLEMALQHLTDQFDATFPLSAFPNDGKRRPYALVHAGETLAGTSLQMPEPPPPPPPSKTWRYLVVAGVVAAFTLLSLLMFRRRS